tara:strand:- start:2128 stop:2583 length:456 start_codon:yes stop_codon:yes gene_type:complete
MITIGFRAGPKTVSFAVYDSENLRVINIEDLRIPAAFAIPDALKYVRSNILDIMREYDVKQAGIRTTEPFAKATNEFRVQVEGVIQEAFASSSLESYFVGHIAVISAILNVDKTEFKPIIDGRNDFDIEGWSAMTKERREAVLTAIGAVNA